MAHSTEQLAADIRAAFDGALAVSDPAERDAAMQALAEAIASGVGAHVDGAPVPAHASTHRHGGADELAAGTPAAFAIPKADAAGTLADWIAAATTTAAGKVELATDGEVAAGLAVQANDSRLPNARAPPAHASIHEPGGGDALAVDALAATGSLRTLGAGAQQACGGTDARLSDARAPTAHAASHVTGGGDKIRDAGAAQDGLMTAAYAGKLDGLPASAPPTSRTITAGAGLLGGGDLSADRTFDIAANVDGSIVVNADDIQVGVLASDAQHGARGGATQHAAATGATAGFMAAADKSKLDGLPASAVPTSRAISTSAPLSGGGDLSADRTIEVADFIASGAIHARGTVPDPGAVPGTSKFLREDATWAAPASAAVRQTEIDFGAAGIEEKTFIVVDAAVGPGDFIVAQIAYVAPTGKDLDELEFDALDFRCVAGTGDFTLYARAIEGPVADKFVVNYVVG